MAMSIYVDFIAAWSDQEGTALCIVLGPNANTDTAELSVKVIHQLLCSFSVARLIQIKRVILAIRVTILCSSRVW